MTVCQFSLMLTGGVRASHEEAGQPQSTEVATNIRCRRRAIPCRS
jgi:hypothetical protein